MMVYLPIVRTQQIDGPSPRYIIVEAETVLGAIYKINVAYKGRRAPEINRAKIVSRV